MRSLFVAAFAALFCASSLQAATLRALLIGDTNDRSIGKSVVTDLANVEAFMRDIAAKTGLKLDLKVLKGAQIKSKIVTAAVNGLKAESDDTVIFYYSGHGFRTQQVKTRWPLLYIPDAGDKGVDFQWVIDTLQQKQPRMVLAISDSCNSFIDSPPRTMGSRSMQVDQEALWKKLFVEFSGRIYASGSQVGQFSFGEDSQGGAFTSRFLSIVRSEVKKNDTNWDTIMKQATKQIPINSAQQKTQDPQYQLVKGQAAQQPQASIEQEITAAEPASGNEANEQCQSISEFQSALASVKEQLPPKLNFYTQKDDVASYKDMVKALVEVGGDKPMVSFARAMDQGLKARNWGRFRMAFINYEGHITKLQKSTCGQ
ncbi:MAG: caspase family protein [Turneriella sp.]|nr:caspase family protein [Turneriella sp.]